jgi:hypothetical protein
VSATDKPEVLEQPDAIALLQRIVVLLEQSLQTTAASAVTLSEVHRELALPRLVREEFQAKQNAAAAEAADAQLCRERERAAIDAAEHARTPRLWARAFGIPTTRSDEPAQLPESPPESDRLPP